MTEKFTLSSLHQLQHQRARAGLPLHVQPVNRDAGTQPNGSISFGVLINARTGCTPGGSAGGPHTRHRPRGQQTAGSSLPREQPDPTAHPEQTRSRKTRGTAVPPAGTARVTEPATTGPASPRACARANASTFLAQTGESGAGGTTSARPGRGCQGSPLPSCLSSSMAGPALYTLAQHRKWDVSIFFLLAAWGSRFPDQGLNSRPPQWKQSPTTGWPGKP